MPLKLKKQVAELLILSKMDYADIEFRPLSLEQRKGLQKVENAAACFVLGRYTLTKRCYIIRLVANEREKELATCRASF